MAPRTQPPNPAIGERIRDRRTARGWSIRHAASRAGMAHTTWMRIEKGEIRTDRYVIADIAAALECSIADLTGQPGTPAGRALEIAHGRVPLLWQALIEIAPDEPPDRAAPPTEALTARMELLDARRVQSDYAATGQILPELLLDLHAAAHGPDPEPALSWLVDAAHTARGTLRGLGYVTEAVLAAERCRQAAELLGEPVPLAVADWARANAASGSGSYRRAGTLAERALADLDSHVDAEGALPMLGMLHLSAAHANLRARPVEAFAHLTEATAIAGRTGETRQWWMSFGPSNVGIWHMGALVDAGEAGRALELAATLRPTELESADRRASFYVELARALVDAKRAPEAERALLTAERLAPQRIRSYTAAKVTARFLRDKARRASPLYGLCERMGVAD